MAKAAVAVAKKKRKDDDDEDAAPKKKRRASEVDDADEDEDEDEDDEDEEDTDSSDDADDDDDDADESEDEDSDDDEDDDDSDSDDDDESDDDDDAGDDDSDDDEDDSSDDDDSDNEDDSDDDEDEAPRRSKGKGKSGSGSAISWDTDDAESGGLPEGRVVLLNPRTRLGSIADYKEDDPDGVPMLSFDAVPSGKGHDNPAPFEIHLTAGKAERILPNDEGTDFISNPDAKKQAKGLNTSTNAFLFIRSLEEAGLPKKKLRMKGIVGLDGIVVELTRVPAPKRTFAAAQEGARDGATIASVSEIYFFPWDPKGEKERAAAKATFAKSKAKKSGGRKGKAKGSKARGPIGRKSKKK